jgi:hypothetical protein
MKNNSWIFKVPLYLDTSLKDEYQEIYKYINLKFENVRSVESYENYLGISIVCASTQCIHSGAIPQIKPNDILVEFISDIQHLNFLSEFNYPAAHFILNPADSIELLKNTIAISLNLFLESKINELWLTGKQFFQKLKKRNDPDDWDERELDTIFEHSDLIQLGNDFNEINVILNKYNMHLKYATEVLFEKELKQNIGVYHLGYDLILLESDFSTMNINFLTAFLEKLVKIISLRVKLLQQQELLQNSVDTFLLMQYPLVVIENDRDIYFHNPAFMKLNLTTKDCLQFSSGQKITFQNKRYNVNVMNLNDDYKIILFKEMDDFLGVSFKPSTEQLGIVTSSIAHELNNPIGAMMAAVTLLELEDDFYAKNKEDLADIKNVLQRCKLLVETFLGFSKVVNHNQVIEFEIQHVFDQAMNLLRYRLAENSLNLILNLKPSRTIKRYGNPSIFIVMIYLLISEVITKFSRYTLVTQKKVSKINCDVSHDLKKISFVFDFPLQGFLLPKMIEHLLEMLQAHFIQEEESILSIHFI